jgi:hypothetical protein
MCIRTYALGDVHILHAYPLVKIYIHEYTYTHTHVHIMFACTYIPTPMYMHTVQVIYTWSSGKHPDGLATCFPAHLMAIQVYVYVYVHVCVYVYIKHMHIITTAVRVYTKHIHTHKVYAHIDTFIAGDAHILSQQQCMYRCIHM